MASITDSITLGQLVFDKRTLISLSGAAPISEALALMNKHNVLSIAVENDGAFEGIVSIFEIMTVVAFGSFKHDAPTVDDFRIFQSMDTPLRSLLGMHDENADVLVKPATSTLTSVMEALSKGYHRLLVEQKNAFDGKMEYRMVTQTDVVRYLARNLDRHTATGNSPDLTQNLETLHLWGPADADKVASVKVSDSALSAFRLMERTGAVCVPVVDEDGVLVTQISASDLRGLQATELKAVLDPVVDFLKSRRGGRLTHPVTATPRSLLEEVMLQMLVAKVHRVWLVDSAQHPIGVVSLTNIICKFSPFDYTN